MGEIWKLPTSKLPSCKWLLLRTYDMQAYCKGPSTTIRKTPRATHLQSTHFYMASTSGAAGARKSLAAEGKIAASPRRLGTPFPIYPVFRDANRSYVVMEVI